MTLNFDLILDIDLNLDFVLTLDSDFIGLQKMCKIFASELRSMSGVMRGFQKGITLRGRTSESVNLIGLQNRVAKKLQIFCI